MADKKPTPVEQYHADLRALMRTPEGKRVLGKFITNIWWETIVTGHPDQNAYNQGRRSVNMEMCNAMRQADLKAYHLMELEIQQEREDQHGR